MATPTPADTAAQQLQLQLPSLLHNKIFNELLTLGASNSNEHPVPSLGSPSCEKEQTLASDVTD